MLGAVRVEQWVAGSGQSQWRELGQGLAHTLRQSKGTISTPARLQAVAADLAGERQELLLPLKDLVCRPAFQALIPRAGSGGGAVQRDLLIQEMALTFSPQVMAAIAALLDGFLDLPPQAAWQPDPRAASPSAAASASASVFATPAPGPAPVPAAAAPPLAPDPLPPPPPPSPRPARAARRPAPPPVRMPEPLRAPEPRLPLFRLALLSLATAVAVAAGVVALRGTDLCALVGLCGGVQMTGSVVQALQAAEQAELDLRQASDLRSYEQALISLERELLGLSGARLRPVQEQRRLQLDQVARDARAVLAAEKDDELRLERALRALDAAGASSGQERASQLAVATEELGAIPQRSFAAGEARQLRRRLERLEREAVVTEPPQPEDTTAPVPSEPTPPTEEQPLPVSPPPPPPPEEGTTDAERPQP